MLEQRLCLIKVVCYVYELTIRMLLLLPTSNGYDFKIFILWMMFSPCFVEFSNLLSFFDIF